MAKMMAYKSIVSCDFIYKNKTTTIPTEGIKAIILDHNYNRTMPIIIMSLNINYDLYNQMVNLWKEAKIYLNIKIYDATARNAVRMDRLKKQFVYFLPNNATYIKDLSPDNQNKDQSYRHLIIGLMDMDLINYNKKSFNGVYRNTTTSEIINLIVGSRDIYKSNLYKDEKLETFLMPPKTSRSEALKYLSTYKSFYNGTYTYYMDFDKSYLVDHTIRSISNNSKFKTVVLDIYAANEEESYYEGMTKDNDSNCYILYLNIADTSVTINRLTEKTATKLVKVTSYGSETYDLDIEKSKYSEDKELFVRGIRESEMTKQELENSNIIINTSKANIDASIITPDRIYVVKNYKDYSEYNGKYLLIYKKEILVQKDGEFTTSTTMGFRKLKE